MEKKTNYYKGFQFYQSPIYLAILLANLQIKPQKISHVLVHHYYYYEQDNASSDHLTAFQLVKISSIKTNINHLYDKGSIKL